MLREVRAIENTVPTENSVPNRTRVAGCLILILIVAIVWMSGAGGGFVWIDHVEIEQAGYRVTSWWDFQRVWSVSLDGYLEREAGHFVAQGGYFRPIYALLISLDWEIWGDNPVAFHAVGILVHALVAAALFLLGLQLLGQQPHRVALSFSAALLFAVHPLGVHSVTWISGRKDSLCALFAIMALIGFGRLMSSRKKRSPWQRAMLILISVIALNLGMLCKELAIVTPAFATVWIWFAARNNNISRDCYPLLGLFWMSSVLAIVYRKILLGGIGLSVDYPAESVTGNVLTSLNLVACYVFRILAPGQPTIVDRWPIREGLEAVDWFAVVFGLAILTALIWSIARRHLSGLMLCWFLIWLLPATGIVPLRHMYAERYLYPASWGLLFTAVILGHDLVQRLRGNLPIFFGVVASVAVLLMVQTIAANQRWKSDQSLFTHAVAQNEHYVEGLSALALLELQNQNYPRALEFAQAAIESVQDPAYRSYWSPFGVYTNAGLAAYYLGEFDQAKSYFQTAIQFRPSNPLSHYHLGLVAVASNELANAESCYRQAINLQPSHHLSRNNLGHLYLITQRFQQCIEILEPTVDAEPTNQLAHANIGTAYLLTDDFPNAQRHFEIVNQLAPDNAITLAKLAWSEFELGMESSAKQHLASASRILPDHPTVRHVQQKYLRN